MLRLLLLFAFSAAYPHVQATALFTIEPPGVKTISVQVRLHDTGGMASSCVVTAGGQKKVTGVSANGDATVWFDKLTNYKGYTVACSVN